MRRARHDVPSPRIVGVRAGKGRGVYEPHGGRGASSTRNNIMGGAGYPSARRGGGRSSRDQRGALSEAEEAAIVEDVERDHRVRPRHFYCGCESLLRFIHSTTFPRRSARLSPLSPGRAASAALPRDRAGENRCVLARGRRGGGCGARAGGGRRGDLVRLVRLDPLPSLLAAQRQRGAHAHCAALAPARRANTRESV